MDKKLTRKEVWLTGEAINRLQQLANRKKWSLKSYMEYVLVKDSGKLISPTESISNKIKKSK